VIARGPGIGLTAVRIFGTGGKMFAIPAKTSVIVGRIIVTAEAIDPTDGKIIRTSDGIGAPTKGIIRTSGGIGAPTKEIFKTIGDIGAPTRGMSGTTGDFGVTTEAISGDSRASGAITKGISGPNVAFGETPNAIIPQDQIAGIDDLLNVTGIDIPADPTAAGVGAELAGVRTFTLG